MVAVPLGNVLPVVGSPVIAIVLGLVVAIIRPPRDPLRPGLQFVSKRILQFSVVLLGTGLSIDEIATVGTASLPVLAGTLVVALTAAALVGAALGLTRDIRTLIGVGTAICGAAAIAATDAVIAAPEADVSYAVATIFAFNVVAVLTFPLIGHMLGMSQHAFGLWSGTAINDTSSVVAASSVYGHLARNYGVVVKLTRTLMIIPIVIGLATWRARRVKSASGLRGSLPGPRWSQVVPWFIAWFIAAAALNTLHAIPAGWHGGLSELATIMITAALAAIGLSTRIRDIRRAGPRPLMLGAILWVAVAITSLSIQAATGTI
jgi:uncharacterized integral membrane protein (TIGR00698 family)